MDCSPEPKPYARDAVICVLPAGVAWRLVGAPGSVGAEIELGEVAQGEKSSAPPKETVQAVCLYAFPYTPSPVPEPSPLGPDALPQ